MSILINMEMPKNCGDCKAFVCYRQWAGDVGDCFCGITKNDAEAKKKNADCPLAPVPPHGRLIEAEAAKEFLKPIDSLFCYEPEWTWGELYESNCAAIDKLPTIIEAEEGE